MPQSALSTPFGFTSELQNAQGLTYLRARWYNSANGSFTAYRWRSDESWDTISYSNHPYAYALSNPVRYTDPTGKYFSPGSGDPSGCPVGYVFDPSYYHATRGDRDGTGCIPMRGVTDVGYIEGASGTVQGLVGAVGGSESLWDLYNFEYGIFDYSGLGIFADLGFGGVIYSGEVYEWSNFNPSSIERYSGAFTAVSLFVNVGFPGVKVPGVGASGGVIGFASPDFSMYSYASFSGTGLTLCAPIDGNIVWTEYVFNPATKRTFHDEGKRPTSRDAQEFINFIEATMIDPAYKQKAKEIVRSNGLYWDAYGS